MKLYRRLFPLLAVLSLAFAGCGSSSDDNGPDAHYDLVGIYSIEEAGLSEYGTVTVTVSGDVATVVRTPYGGEPQTLDSLFSVFEDDGEEIVTGDDGPIRFQITVNESDPTGQGFDIHYGMIFDGADTIGVMRMLDRDDSAVAYYRGTYKNWNDAPVGDWILFSRGNDVSALMLGSGWYFAGDAYGRFSGDTLSGSCDYGLMGDVTHSFSATRSGSSLTGTLTELADPARVYTLTGSAL